MIKKIKKIIKKALIFGITGQDGAYLSKLLKKELSSLWSYKI